MESQHRTCGLTLDFCLSVSNMLIDYYFIPWLAMIVFCWTLLVMTKRHQCSWLYQQQTMDIMTSKRAYLWCHNHLEHSDVIHKYALIVCVMCVYDYKINGMHCCRWKFIYFIQKNSTSWDKIQTRYCGCQSGRSPYCRMIPFVLWTPDILPQYQSDGICLTDNHNNLVCL